MNVLETCGLGQRYRRNWALRDCSLTVPAGHVVALVGPNGAGNPVPGEIAPLAQCLISGQRGPLEKCRLPGTTYSGGAE
jgi:ABC-type Na+ transport system ATPase subunit NatA